MGNAGNQPVAPRAKCAGGSGIYGHASWDVLDKPQRVSTRAYISRVVHTCTMYLLEDLVVVFLANVPRIRSLTGCGHAYQTRVERLSE